MTSIAVVGEALVDVISDAHGTRRHPGGSPLNVAVGLARLGHDATLVTRLGDDADGTLLQEHLGAAGVHLANGAVDRAATSLALASLDSAGRAEYVFRLDWRLPEVALPPATQHVHTGSIAVFLEPGAAQVGALVRQHRPRSTISFDPNVRPAIVGALQPARERVEELVASSDVVKVSDEDLAWLEPGRSVTDVAREWLARGPSLVVVTRGGEGAVAVAACGEVEVEAPAIALVDTVGAGDAFMSGLLDDLARRDLLGAERREALRSVRTQVLAQVVGHAVHVAALTCTRAGAEPPTRDELHAWLDGAPPA